MLLKTITKQPLKARQYLERYVNDGSPSGFSDLYRTSQLTDPLALKPWFYIYCCLAPVEWFKKYGSFRDGFLDYKTDDWIFLHPDIINDDRLKLPEIRVMVEESFRVTPTASSRTVQIISRQSSDYIKLHFEGILGRVKRALPFQKAIAGPEITEELIRAIDKDLLPESFSILPETGLRCLEIPGLLPEQGIGMIWRANEPYGKMSKRIKHIWPLFSLYSTDRLSPLDEPLLIQIIGNSNSTAKYYVLERLIFPILECYFRLILNLGYHMECNSENLMIGLDDSFDVRSVVIRDIMRFEKDITIRTQLGLPIAYRSAPYKCIDEKDELYQIRHSFCFDFKMSYYVIHPIIDLVASEYDLNMAELEKEIKEYVLYYLKKLPENYFPRDGLWYKHERILLTDKRPYVGSPNPRFR